MREASPTNPPIGDGLAPAAILNTDAGMLSIAGLAGGGGIIGGPQQIHVEGEFIKPSG